jgi:DNA-directed RNA polymerase subunit K/omega
MSYNYSLPRAVLIREIVYSKLNLYLLCNVLFQRTRQLTACHPEKHYSEAINTALTEFREGKLEYELPGPNFRLAVATEDCETKPIRNTSNKELKKFFSKWKPSTLGYTSRPPR